MKKKLGVILLGTSLLLSSIPTFGNTTPVISQWAVKDICEAEKYGIYSIDWYETSFKVAIDQDKLNSLYKGVCKKLGEAGLTNPKEVAVVQGTTKGDVIKGLYAQLAAYTETEKVLNPKGLDSIEYFKDKGYVKGTQEGLELDKVCTTEQAIILASNFIKGVYADLDKGGQGLGYKITHNDNTVYLLGSIHLGTIQMYPIDTDLRAAFEESEELFVEANILVQQNTQDMLNKAVYNDGTTLKEHISSELYEETVQALEKYKLPAEDYLQFRPWFLATSIENLALAEQQDEELVMQSILGVDRYFIEQAMLGGKKVTELEGLSYQAELFNSLSDEYQEAYLESATALALYPDENAEVLQDSNAFTTDIKKYWCEGEYEKFIESYSKTLSEESEFSKMLLGKRDENMAQKLTQLLEQEGEHTYFVVVGAAHVLMPDMVGDLLKEKGYNVAQIN